MASTDVSVATTRKRAKATVPTVPAINDTQALIEAITKASRDPDVIIEKMNFLLDTRRKLLDEAAEQEWRDEMALVQAKLAPISKDLPNAQTGSRYSSLGALDAAVRPIYSEHGFSITYDTEHTDEPNSLLVVCYVERGRHSRRYSIPMPCDGKGPRGNDVMSKTHATGSAVTYGRRYLLCMALNLVTADDDGNRAGGVRLHVEPPIERASHTRKAMAQAYPDDPPSPQLKKVFADAQSRKGSLAETQLEASIALITKKELADLYKLMGEAGDSEEKERVLKDHFEIPTLDMLTHAEFEVACNKLRGIILERQKNAK
jgi:hypothetical protein